jgi:hypothetical protein
MLDGGAGKVGRFRTQAREPIEQRRLPRVGIARDGNLHWPFTSLADAGGLGQ